MLGRKEARCCPCESETAKRYLIPAHGAFVLRCAQGRSVVVLCNLKPRNMRGVKSNGMVRSGAAKQAKRKVAFRVPESGAT